MNFVNFGKPLFIYHKQTLNSTLVYFKWVFIFLCSLWIILSVEVCFCISCIVYFLRLTEVVWMMFLECLPGHASTESRQMSVLQQRQQLHLWEFLHLSEWRCADLSEIISQCAKCKSRGGFLWFICRNLHFELVFSSLSGFMLESEGVLHHDSKKWDLLLLRPVRLRQVRPCTINLWH